MQQTYLWQEPDFPHFYWNCAAAEPLEEKFKNEMTSLLRLLEGNSPCFDDVLTEEIIANSEIEGVLLDRDSVNSSFVNNITPTKEKEQGAVTLTKMALEHWDKPLTHELIKSMHHELMQGTNFPDESIGEYVGDMKIVSGNRLDKEYTIVHEGVSKELVCEYMSQFIDWYNQTSPKTPLTNAIQGHIHFENIHPFCDGNGRIGRNLMLMGLCRDFGRTMPIALSRAFQSDIKEYYGQFSSGLDLTNVIKSMTPLLLEAVKETGRILDLTAYRTKVSDIQTRLNPRQLKVLNRVIDYELRDRFKGGMNNAKYQKMTGIGGRTALRDLNELHQLGLMFKTGQLKGTRYHLKLDSQNPHTT